VTVGRTFVLSTVWSLGDSNSPQPDCELPNKSSRYGDVRRTYRNRTENFRRKVLDIVTSGVVFCTPSEVTAQDLGYGICAPDRSDGFSSIAARSFQIRDLTGTRRCYTFVTSEVR